MDAARAREQLRRRYLFSPDAEASLDGRGCARPGRRSPGRSEPRRGPGPGARSPPALRPPAARPVGRARLLVSGFTCRLDVEWLVP